MLGARVDGAAAIVGDVLVLGLASFLTDGNDAGWPSLSEILMSSLIRLFMTQGLLALAAADDTSTLIDACDATDEMATSRAVGAGDAREVAMATDAAGSLHKAWCADEVAEAADGTGTSSAAGEVGEEAVATDAAVMLTKACCAGEDPEAADAEGMFGGVGAATAAASTSS